MFQTLYDDYVCPLFHVESLIEDIIKLNVSSVPCHHLSLKLKD